VVLIDSEAPAPAAIAEAAAILARGDVVAFSTETVYGLGADATQPNAVLKVFEAKGRPAENPLIVHVASVEMARACVSSWPEDAEKLAGAFWPGPLTLVLPRSALIPTIVTAGLDTVGIRMPRTSVARALIESLGRPIAAPSANRSTALSPTAAAHVIKDLGGRMDMILDSGPTAVGLESTVLDLSRGSPYRILRPGPIGALEIERACGSSVVDAMAPAPGAPLTSPGQMPIHYAPRTALQWVEPDAVAHLVWPPQAACLVIGVERGLTLPPRVLTHDLRTPEEAARELYATLHAWDDLGLERIFVVPPPDRPEWAAVRDRLKRAASQSKSGIRSSSS
jgi:L-threonylcarbamoyladenylate synthase